MEEILVNALKDIPFTALVLIIFLILNTRILDNAKKDGESKDALIGRLISLLEKLSGVVENLKTTLEERTKIINEQVEAFDDMKSELKELKEEIQELKQIVNTEVRIKSTSDTGVGSNTSVTITKTA